MRTLCGSELARDGLKGDAFIQKTRVIVNVHREQARSHKGAARRQLGLSGVGGVNLLAGEKGLENLGVEQLDIADLEYLALSLHAPNDALRNQLVPINKKYPLKMLLESCQRYMSSLGEKRVLTIEYTLLKDVNDKVEHAVEMIELLKYIPCKINLIPFNPFPHSGYERPSNNASRRFQDLLHHAGFNVTVRTTRGEDIDAACGQLVGQVLDRTRRSERYIAVRELNADNDMASNAAK